MECTSVNYLITPLRRHLGDLTEPYEYEDAVLSGCLLDAVKALGTRWQGKYYVAEVESVEDQVVRNSNADLFEFSEPPVIQYQDERPIILQASIIIKGSIKFDESGSVSSWRDEEFSYSNIESARQRSSTLDDDLQELNRILPIKLAKPVYGRLYGDSKDWE
jgi:hypothetical protein